MYDVRVQVVRDGEFIDIGQQQIEVLRVLSNFSQPLDAQIVVQGKMSRNRWIS